MSAEVSYLDIEAAQRRAERIRFHATNANEAMQSLLKLIAQAQELEDHVTLGYASWTAYVADVFGNEPMRLAGEVRRALSPQLSETGMSNRAIASVLGVSEGTIRNDLAGAQNYAPAPEPSASVMNVAQAPTETFDADGILIDAATGEVIEPTVTEHTVTEKVKTVTGLDGKEYKRPEPKPRESKPVLAGEEADRANAIQTSKAVGQALASLERFQYENARTQFLSSTWPTGREEVQPIHRGLVAPAELRKVAESLITLASEMESHDDYQ